MKGLILLALVGFAVAQVQIQIPVQRPQQPQPPVHWAPNPPSRPIQPQPPQWQPRADWRDGDVDSRCANPDNHQGNAQLLPGPTPNTFFICWGTRAWPFTCPGNSVFRQDAIPGPACADPGWEPQNNNGWNNWNRRPFNGDEEEAEE